MIPKKIHYCWIGDKPLSELAQKCIETWKRYCPDYEIIEWNESNYNFGKNEYMKSAYSAKIWGFVPDYARLDIIYQYGGIYLDTDVEILRNFDDLLDSDGFVGMERPGQVNLGQGFAATAGNQTIKKMLDMYENMEFVNDKDYLANHASPVYQTKCLKELGLTSNNEIQKVGAVTVYPTEFFCPKDIDTGIVDISENTYSIHHFDGSWAGDTERYGYHLKWDCINKYGKIIGKIIYFGIYSCFILKNEGLGRFLNKLRKKISGGFM